MCLLAKQKHCVLETSFLQSFRLFGVVLLLAQFATAFLRALELTIQNQVVKLLCEYNNLSRTFLIDLGRLMLNNRLLTNLLQHFLQTRVLRDRGRNLNAYMQKGVEKNSSRIRNWFFKLLNHDSSSLVVKII